MADRSVVVRLRAEVNQFVAGMQRAKQEASHFGREMTGHGQTSRRSLEELGRGAAVMAGGLTLALGASAKAAMDWESSWAGVTKTVDGSAEEMAALEGSLRDLAKELPATHGEIAAVAEAAGQLGISREHIAEFTETMVALGETTNLTADAAATALARMSNIMGTSQDDIDKMASTLVALGNAGASTESEILDMAMRIAGAAKQVGITEAATLGFANALSSVGIEAEAGGTAISRVFSTIATEVADGGDALDEFARVAGMSSEDFRRAFQEDAAGATIAFIEGLSRIKGEGENVFAVLKDLELGDIRVRDALLRASSAGDLFRESLALGAEEWEANLALQTEAEKRYDTTAAKLQVARNNVVDLAINIGDQLLPVLGGLAEGLSTVVQGFSNMPGPMDTVALGIGGVAAAGLGMIAAAGILLPKLQALRTTLLGMGAAGKAAAASMPWLAAAAAAIGAVSYVFGQQAKEAEEAEARVKGYTDAIREAGDATSGTQDAIRSLLVEMPEFAGLLDDMGVSADDLGEALAGSDAEWSAMRSSLLEAAEAAGVSGMALDSLKAGLDEQRAAALQGAEDAATLGRVLGETGDEAAGATDGVDDLTGGLEQNAEAAAEARKEFEDLLDAYRASVDPLFGMLDAVDANRQAQQDLTEALALNSDGIADNEKSAAELDAMYRAVAETALDVEVAARELAFAVQEGTVSVDTAKMMLAEWVAQGLITEGQAAKVAEQFDIAAGKADAFGGKDVAATIGVNDHATPVIDNATRRLAEFAGRHATATLSALFSWGGSTGGRVPQYRAAGGSIFEPRGTDTVPAMLTPGEFVMQKSAVDRFGVGFMEAINRGTMSPASQSITPARAEVVLRVDGGDADMVRMVQKWVRTQGGGNVQVLAGR